MVDVFKIITTAAKLGPAVYQILSGESRKEKMLATLQDRAAKKDFSVGIELLRSINIKPYNLVGAGDVFVRR